MGLLQNSTQGFGTLSVSGRKRVPNPPTKISAFMMKVATECCLPANAETHHSTNKWLKKLIICTS
jgi:hypothetical protein